MQIAPWVQRGFLLFQVIREYTYPAEIMTNSSSVRY
jgi:hypothetical protein